MKIPVQVLSEMSTEMSKQGKLENLARELSKELAIERKKSEIFKLKIQDLSEKLEKFKDFSDKFQEFQQDNSTRQEKLQDLVTIQQEQIQNFKENSVKSQSVLENLQSYSLDLLEKLKVSTGNENSYKIQVENYKTEIEKMGSEFKKYQTQFDTFLSSFKKSEKSNLKLKERIQKVNSNLLLVVQESQGKSEEIIKLQKENQKLKSLCRALQFKSNSNISTQEDFCDAKMKSQESPSVKEEFNNVDVGTQESQDVLKDVDKESDLDKEFQKLENLDEKAIFQNLDSCIIESASKEIGGSTESSSHS